jgi:Tol biopolymer transport system component
MITGVLPFRGDYEQAVVYGILNEDPDSLTNLRAGVPMALDGVIGKMLSKDPDLRYQNVDELPADLKAIDLGSAITRSRISTGSRSAIVPAAATVHSVVQQPAPASKRKSIPAWGWAVASVLVLATGFMAGRHFSGGPEPVRELMRFEIDLPHAINQMLPSWSPDGSELYYLARTGDDNPVHVRRYTLATGESDAVPGTENAADVEVSADGRWLVVSDGPRQQYRRALRSGGAFTDIPGAESPAEWGIYGSDERFYFSTRNWEIGSTGEDGGVIVHTQRDTSVTYLAVPLPAEEGNTVFFSDWTSRTNTVGTYRLVDHSPGFERVSSQYTFLQVLSNGYALVIPAGSTNQPAALAPIDPENGVLQGPAVPIARLDVFGFAFSRTGHLVYREQRSDASIEAEPLFRLVGQEEPVMISGTPGVSDDFAAARVRNAVAIEADPDNPDGTDIYVINLDSGVQTRMTRGGDNQYAEWSPDDQYVYYRKMSDDSPRGVIMRRRADASEPAELVLANESGSGGGVYHPAVTSDGSHLLFTHDGDEGISQLYRITLENALPLDLADADRLSESDEAVIGPDPSPDDRYVVYRAGQSVLISSIDGQGEVEITSDGSEPVWSPDGAWIYFMRSTDREIYRVAVTTEPVFSLLGSVERVFIVPSHLHYDIAPDGSMLLTMPEGGRQDAGSTIRVVLNLASEAERIAPRNP